MVGLTVILLEVIGLTEDDSFVDLVVTFVTEEVGRGRVAALVRTTSETDSIGGLAGCFDAEVFEGGGSVATEVTTTVGDGFAGDPTVVDFSAGGPDRPGRVATDVATAPPEDF